MEQKQETNTGLLIAGILLCFLGLFPIGIILIIIFAVKNSQNKDIFTDEAKTFIDKNIYKNENSEKKEKKLTKCPNCGANITNSDKCEYCGRVNREN